MVLFYKHLVRYIEKMTVFYNDVTATATNINDDDDDEEDDSDDDDDDTFSGDHKRGLRV